MHLYDELMAARGGIIDQAMLGAITAFTDLLKSAQCFSMSEDVALISMEICRSKPSSILSALDMARVPYPLTWIEWEPSHRIAERDNNKPQPRRVGCLLDTDAAGSKGMFILAWTHGTGPGDISLDPVGLLFDWDLNSKEPVAAQYARAMGIKDIWTIEQRRTEVGKIPMALRWEKYSSVETERQASIDLNLRNQIVPVDFCLPFLHKAQMLPGTPHFESYCDDLAGELPFIEAFLLLLNSRNTIVEQTHEDLTRLNKARAKRKRPPLKEFITTRIKLNRIQRNRTALGTQHEVRTHLCRGHFKLRKSGVYWWSAHMRGTGAPLRRDYQVT